jgi:FG-GAP-like repeat
MNNAFRNFKLAIGVCIFNFGALDCLAQPTFKQIGATAPLASNTHDFVAVYDGSPLSGDFNNDGFQDFILSGTADNSYVPENKLYLNDGEGSFYSVNQDQITAVIRPMSVAGIGKEIDIDFKAGSNQIHCDNVARGNYFIELILEHATIIKTERGQ